MADEEPTFESADAGASHTYPMQAGAVRKGGFIVVKGRPTKVRVSSPTNGESSHGPPTPRPRLPEKIAVELTAGFSACSNPFRRPVVDISTSKTGKHGHAKCHFVTIDIFTGKKLEELVPSSHNLECPNVNRVDYQLLDIDEDDFLSLMKDDGSTKDDLKMPTLDDELIDSIRKNFEDGKDLILTVQEAMGEESVIAMKTVSWLDSFKSEQRPFFGGGGSLGVEGSWVWARMCVFGTCNLLNSEVWRVLMLSEEDATRQSPTYQAGGPLAEWHYTASQAQHLAALLLLDEGPGAPRADIGTRYQATYVLVAHTLQTVRGIPMLSNHVFFKGTGLLWLAIDHA
eukprot:scaffold4147_cov412-Prasinococcus_capsulatus_cf.AAC.13